MSKASQTHTPPFRASLSGSGEILLYLAMLNLLVFEPVPAVNETHYLVKSKHAWDSTFAPGDIFLESHDSHVLFTTLAGNLARLMPLTAVAWWGRVACWFFVAWAWRKLMKSLEIPTVVGIMSLVSWYLAIQFGNWAGEWAIGGFEAKSLAYPCILVAIAEVIEQRWKRAWLWLGLSVAWHPVVGGWAGLAVGFYWLSLPELSKRGSDQFAGLSGGLFLGLVGVLPAAFGLSGPNQVGNLLSSQIHVYFRLAHHQCPQRFMAERHWAGAVSLSLLIAVTLFRYLNVRNSLSTRQVEGSRFLLWIAWVSVGFSAVGLLIDLALTQTRPDIASQFLRFYWFRLSDVFVPLGWTLTFWSLLGEGYRFLKESDTKKRLRGPAFTKSAILLLAGLVVLLLVGRQVASNLQRQYPSADQMMMDAPILRSVESDRYVDWLAVCDWARNNSPTEALWFTPRHQQTFKWYAQRAEVVNWKDVPQDNQSARRWYQRVVDCDLPRIQSKSNPQEYLIQEWSSEQLLKLAKKYGFRWILVDRRIQERPLLQFEIMYPIETQNRSFAIFRIPEGLLNDSSEVDHDGSKAE